MVLITVLNQTDHFCRRSGKHQLMLLLLRLLGRVSKHTHTWTPTVLQRASVCSEEELACHPPPSYIHPSPSCSIGGTGIITAN